MLPCLNYCKCVNICIYKGYKLVVLLLHSFEVVVEFPKHNKKLFHIAFHHNAVMFQLLTLVGFYQLVTVAAIPRKILVEECFRVIYMM